MSNLLKSKLFLGVMIAGAMLVAVSLFAFAFVSTADAQACSITSTLRVGSRGTQVQCLQSSLGVTADGAFGPITKAAVQAWQTSKGLVADGVFGPLSRAAWSGSSVSGLPAGCTSTAGFSPTTGVPCNSGGTTSLPAGCTSTAGFSPTTGQSCSGGGSVVVGGPVSVSLAADNPAPSTLVAGQATADLAHFNFMGSGTVTAVKLKRTGVSADSTPSNVYLFDGATRLTDAASVSSNGEISFNNPAGLFIVSGSKVISVQSDIAASTSGQTVGVMLVSFTTGSTVVTANLSGNIHTIASATLATVSAGTVTPSGATINPGPNQTLWQSTLTIGNRDVWMKRLALRQVGSALASSMQNFKLYVNGVQVATATGLDANGYVTFDMRSSPVLLVAGSRVVRVDADVVSGASRTINLSLRTAADVDFVDSSFGVNISATSTPWGPAAASTISGSSGGTLTVEKDVSSPSTNLVNNASDATLGIFKLTAFGESIKVENLRATYTSSDAAIGSLRNGRILVSTDGTNWVQYGSTATLNEDSQGTPYTQYTVNVTIVPGTPVWVKLNADIYDNDGTDSITTNTDTVAGVLAIGSSNALRVDSLGYFNAPSSAVSANTLTIATTSVTLSRNNTYAAQNTTLPATNFKIGSWNLAGSSIEDVLLTTLSFDVDEVTGTTFNEDDITNMYVVVKNSSGAVVAQPSPIATVVAADDNYSINYTLMKNQSVSIELFGNFGSTVTATHSFKTDLTVTGTSLVGGSSITATSADTDGQTITFATAYIQASVDASSPDLAIVSDNQTVTSGAFKFSAVTAGFNVTDLTFTIADVTAVQNVMLYDGSTLVASLPASATTTFSGLSWNVPANTSRVLTVKLQLGSVGLGAGTSQASLLTTMTVFTSVNTSTGVSDASDADSGQSRESTADPAAAAQYVYAAIPLFTQGIVSATLTNAIDNELYKFIVTPQGGAVALKQLKFTIVLTDGGTDDTLTLGTLKLYRGSTDISADVDIHATAGTTFEDTNSLAEGSTTVIVTWSSEEQVSSATEYALRGTPAGFATPADNDSINVNIATDSAIHTAANSYLIDLDTTAAQATIGLAPSTGVAQDNAAHGTDAATVTNGPNVLWSDVSALPHTETVVDAGTTATSSADWTNGYLVQYLPLSGMTKNN